MTQLRQLAAIMFTDIVGYTALMGNDEKKALLYLDKNRAMQKPVIEQHNGRWIKELGDGVMASFSTVSDAVNAAIKIQEACNNEKEFQLRIGIHLGEVVLDNGDVFGDGVNVASRIQAAAEPGCIYVSESVRNNVSNKKDIQTKFIREAFLKNVKEPVRIYEIVTGLSPDYNGADEILKKVFPGNSIAVLPFVNMSNDPEQEFFSDGISEEIINTLAQVPNLKVPGRTSSFTFKGKNDDVRTIGEKLSVNTILEGSVRSSGNRIRITAQLINVQDGFHVWSEKFDRTLNDIFEVQDEIAETIVKKLQVTFEGHSAHLKSREQTENIEAYKCYLKGRALVYKRGKHLFEAKSLFEKALEIDPEYALAYAGLADTFTIICYFGLLDPEVIWPKAIYNAQLAMKFGPELAETQNCNATIALLHDWDYKKAEREYLKALEINPGYEQALTWYGYFYLCCATLKREEGVKNCREAVARHPLSSYSHSVLALSLGTINELSEALEMSKEAVKIDPESYLTQITLAGGYTVMGEFDMGIKTFEMVVAISNRHSWAYAFLGIANASCGKMEKAKEIYEELISGKTFVQPALIATVAASLGYYDEALKYAHIGVDKHDPFLILSEGNPLLKALGQIPKFDEIRKRMNLID
jgi:adenylate cyclase